MIFFYFFDCMIKKSFFEEKRDSRLPTLSVDSTKKFLMFLNFFALLMSDIFHIALLSSVAYDISFGDIYSINIIIIFIFSKRFLGQKYYKHQYYSMLIIILSLVGNFIFGIAFRKYKIYNFLLYFLINILFSGLQSISYSYIKEYMNNYFYSPFKICCIHGKCNILLIIIYFVVSFCNDNGNKFPYANIFIFFQDSTSWSLLLIIGGIIKAINTYYINYYIKIQ